MKRPIVLMRCDLVIGQVPPSQKVMSDTYNCTLGPPWVNVTFPKMYKNEKKLLYPVNVGRNIARESAPTFYVFASDIELYPNPNLPAKFVEMIRKRNQPALYKPNPRVFVLSIFEVDEKCQPPNNKTHLVSGNRRTNEQPNKQIDKSFFKRNENILNRKKIS